MTYRQQLVWEERHRNEWRDPPLPVRYLQFIALEVRRSWVKYPARVKLEQMLLKPAGVADPSIVDGLSDEEAAEVLKNRHLAMLGGNLQRMSWEEAKAAGLIIE